MDSGPSTVANVLVMLEDVAEEEGYRGRCDERVEEVDARMFEGIMPFVSWEGLRGGEAIGVHFDLGIGGLVGGGGSKSNCGSSFWVRSFQCVDIVQPQAVTGIERRRLTTHQVRPRLHKQVLPLRPNARVYTIARMGSCLRLRFVRGYARVLMDWVAR